MKGKRLIFWAMIFIPALCAVLWPATWPDAEDPPERVKAILVKSCVVCHKGPYPPMGLSLEPDRIAAAVNAPSREIPSLKIIDTGDPEKSYLLKKVRGDAGMIGKSMPPENPLTSEEIEALSAWIVSLKK
jgi:hypothetical protein